jgi:hypothetical protein
MGWIDSKAQIQALSSNDLYISADGGNVDFLSVDLKADGYKFFDADGAGEHTFLSQNGKDIKLTPAANVIVTTGNLVLSSGGLKTGGAMPVTPTGGINIERGTTANRPSTSLTRLYWDTTINKLIVHVGNGNWKDGQGNSV